MRFREAYATPREHPPPRPVEARLVSLPGGTLGKQLKNTMRDAYREREEPVGSAVTLSAAWSGWVLPGEPAASRYVETTELLQVRHEP